jgi:phosphoribosylaminoimidazolecarboxamide formyltransferase / IMP cyclohydrolase
LRQGRDLLLHEQWKVVTKAQFPGTKGPLAEFAWKVCKHVKSNAIVICAEYAPGFFKEMGMGAGQPNRVDSLRKLAVTKTHENLALELKEAGKPESEAYYKEKMGDMVLASDAFFPFSDNIDEAHQAGIKFVVEPGGSKRDADVIAACDTYGIAMIFTNTRHFRH